MKYYTYEELENLVTPLFKAENPYIKPNIKNIGLWLKKIGYKKIKKQIDRERKIYYYLPDAENIREKMTEKSCG